MNYLFTNQFTVQVDDGGVIGGLEGVRTLTSAFRLIVNQNPGLSVMLMNSYK